MTNEKIDAERLAQVTALFDGAHDPAQGQMCAMEAVAWVAREEWSDHPQCACPVISAFVRAWNDGLPDDERTALLLPLIPKLVGTRSTKAVEQRRSTMAADWLIRTNTVAWLRLAGLNVQADRLASLPEIIDFAQCPSLMLTLEAVRADASAALDEAWAATWDEVKAEARAEALDEAWAATWAAARAAALDEARAKAGAAAWDAALDEARAAALDAARAAALDEARAAAWDEARAAAVGALEPTKIALQQSALELLERMIAHLPGENT